MYRLVAHKGQTKCPTFIRRQLKLVSVMYSPQFCKTAALRHLSLSAGGIWGPSQHHGEAYPYLAQAICGGPQVVPRNLGHDVMRHMNIDVEAQELHPLQTCGMPEQARR